MKEIRTHGVSHHTIKIKWTGIILIALLSSFGLHTEMLKQTQELTGTYLNEENDAKVRIFIAKNNKFSGKVEWMKEPNNPDGTPKLDLKNPDPSKRIRSRLGLVIMKNFEYNATEKRWEGGTIYDPKSGKTYDGYLYFSEENPKVLQLRGYVLGMPMLGRTSTWTKLD